MIVEANGIRHASAAASFQRTRLFRWLVKKSGIATQFSADPPGPADGRNRPAVLAFSVHTTFLGKMPA
jgi:hypothetical protein